MSVTVGFSQATSPLIVPAPGTTKPDGTPADGSAEAGGDANLFAALLAMLVPGAQAPAETDPSATPATDAPAVAAVGSTILPASLPIVDTPPETPALPDLQKSEQGKALLKDFTDALKAAKAALDDGKPLDPAVEKKLKDAVAAIAAWFAGQPQLQPVPVDTSKISELAAGSNILPAAPAGDAPTTPAVASPDAVDTPGDAADTGSGKVIVSVVAAQPIPAKLAELGNALKDFATELAKTSPDLATALAGLADRFGAGDISDDVMQQLGLTRSLGSTSPELDQLVAALTTAPATKAATQAAPIAAPVLDIPDVLAAAAQVAATAPVAKKAEIARPEATRPDAPAKTDAATKPEPLTPSTDVKLDAGTKLEHKAGDTSADSKPDTPRKPAAKADRSAPASTPVVTNADAAAAQGVQATQTAPVTAPTAARAIHAAYAAPVQQLNLPQVAFEVARQFEAGNTRFQIRLDPADLGRIDVKLDLDKSGTVSARMFVERPETLDLMMRDQRALQQALQQAGLDTSKTNLEFSLRQNPFAGANANSGQGGGNGGQPGFGPYGAPVGDDSAELAPQTLYRGSASASGVNLFV